MKFGPVDIPPKKKNLGIQELEGKENEEDYSIDLEDYFSGKKSFNDLIELSFDVSEQQQDLLLKQWVNLVEKYPKQADDFMELFAQNPFGTPRGFFDAVFSVITKPGLSSSTISSILGEVNTQFWYRREEMTKIVLEYLNFSDYNNIARTGALLEYITFFIEQSDMDDSFYLETVKSFESILEQKTKEQQGSYLLNIRVQQLLDKRNYDPNIEYAPFEITKGVYAFIKNKQLFLAKEENSNRIAEIIKTIQEVKASGDINKVRQLGNSFRELEEYFTNPVADELFISKQPQDGDVNDFAYLQRKSVRDFIKLEFGLELSILSIPEQFQVLEFIKYQDVNSVKKVKSFAKVFKVEGFRTFLSIEQGGKEMGDKILTLGEKLPEESAKVLFAKYGEIVDQVDDIGLFLRESMGGKVTPDIIEKAKQNLLIRGKDLLNSYADKADICVDTECENIGKELEEKLTNIKASLLLFASACKSLSEEGLLSIEDLANTQLEIVRGSVDEKTQEEMRRIFKENRPNYSKLLLDDVTSEFDENLKNTKDSQTFYVLRNNNDITSFMRLDEESDGSIYGASFNVRTELRGSSIGSELLKKIIEDESSKKPFKIICYDKNPMLEKYKSEFGFEIVGTIENYHNTGEKFYKMVRNPKTK